MHHTQLRISCAPQLTEILIAELSQAGFDTFLETENGLEAYAEEEKYDQHTIHEVLSKYELTKSSDYSFQKIEKQNWNEQWEKSIHPIHIGDQCVIRADFHPPQPEIPYNIIITPKMSFGTGHHATTWLMVKTMFEMNFKNKIVMDVGCGTSVLSILAAKLGAQRVEAFDIDEWSVTNSEENIKRNNVQHVNVAKGTIGTLNFSQKFDVLLANINKNVILSELNLYASHLVPGGYLLLSGFYEKDISDIYGVAGSFGFIETARAQKEDWAVLLVKMKS